MRLEASIFQTCHNGSFNPRICKRCDVFGCSCLFNFYCFNPRICKRCDFPFKPTFLLISVSIHASVKDATFVGSGKLQEIKVSIHASVKDATLMHRSVTSMCICFNPRICKRCDRPLRLYVPESQVSIHASVKDATDLAFLRRRRSRVSIHASVKDATPRNRYPTTNTGFQSTHL